MKPKFLALAAVASLLLLYMGATSWIAGIRYWREWKALGSLPTIGPSDLTYLAIKLNRQLAVREIYWALCYSVAALAGLILTYYLWAGLRRSQRVAGGLCRVCSYDLTGNTSGVCPECGARITEAGGINR